VTGAPPRLAPEPVFAGMRIGLYGGSFNPAHAGHRHVAQTALARFGLDRVWALVSPQNPLKPAGETAPYEERLAAARACLEGPRIRVSDLETRLGSRFSFETARALTARYPQARFVWIMGADAFAGLHRWRNWRDFAAMMPVGVISRPGWTVAALRSPAAQALPRVAPPLLCGTRPPGWSYVAAPFRTESSTAIRAR